METLFLYFGKMILVSAVMSAYYLLFLRDKTFHHYNRFYLLGTMVLSLLLPLLKVEYFTIETDSRILLLLNQFNQNSAQEVENTFNVWNFGALILGIVSFFLLAKLTLGLVKIHQLKKEFPKESIEGITFYNTNLHDAPFSFFRNLFWKKSILINSDLGKQILKHEMVHIEQKHSFDKLFVQMIQSLFWFNPIFYFIKKEITLIHEYLADKKAVKNADTRAFAQMLLASNFSGNVLPATSPFLSSNLKKRLKMLTQKNTKYSYARRILALPILFGVSFALLVNAKNKEIRDFNISVSKMLKDTATIDSARAVSTKENKISAKLAPENALFLIDGKEVSKSKYLKFVEENKDNKELVEIKMFEKDQPNKETVMGERGKYGVYQATTTSNLKNITNDYHDLIKKYNPKHYNDVILKNKLKEKSNQLSEIGKSLQQKTNELKTLKPDSKEFKIKIEEINSLSEKIADSEASMNQLMELNEEQFKELEQKLNFKEFKNGVFKIKNVEFSENSEVKAMAFPSVNIASVEWKDGSNPNLSKEEIKKLEKLSKERTELAKKQAELSKKQAEIARKQAELGKQQAEQGKKQAEIAKQQAEISRKFQNGNNTFMIKIPETKAKPEVYVFKEGDSLPDNVKIYLNDKLITKEELKNIKADDITIMNINAVKNNGVQEKEIRIQTK